MSDCVPEDILREAASLFELKYRLARAKFSELYFRALRKKCGGLTAVLSKLAGVDISTARRHKGSDARGCEKGGNARMLQLLPPGVSLFSMPYPDARRAFSRLYFYLVLEESGGDANEAARRAQVRRSTVIRGSNGARPLSCKQEKRKIPRLSRLTYQGAQTTFTKMFFQRPRRKILRDGTSPELLRYHLNKIKGNS